MRKNLVRTGIDIIGDVPWGTHIGQFFRSREDLFDVLIPFFKTGLESGELCLWLAAAPLDKNDAIETMRREVPDFDSFLSRGQIVIADSSEWNPGENGTVADAVGYFINRIRPLKDGFFGIKLAFINPAPADGKWTDFSRHHIEIEQIANKMPMIILCGYPLEAFKPETLVGALSSHQYSLMRYKDAWSVIGGSDFERLWGNLKATESSFRNVIASFTDGIVITDLNGTVRFANPAAGALFDTNVEEMLDKPFCFPLNEGDSSEVQIIKRNGEAIAAEMRVMETEWEGEAAYLATIRDITPRKRAEEAVRSLPYRLMQMQENERRAIGRELHDQTGQYLTALKLLLVRAMHQPPEKAVASLSEAQTLANELFTQVRELSLSLRPPMLDDLGLLPALLWLFERYTTQTQVHLEFKHAGLERWFPPEVSTAAYRIVQEALTNVARHARTNEAVVRMWTDQEALYLRVEDKGSGFDPEALDIVSATGLNGMRERALLLNGKFNIDSAPGVGTTVSAELPLPGRMENSTEKEKKECQP